MARGEIVENTRHERAEKLNGGSKMTFDMTEEEREQRDAAMDAIKEKLRAARTSTGGQLQDDSEIGDENDQIREKIARRQAHERLEREEEARAAAEAERERLLEEREAEKDAMMEADLEEEESYFEDQEQLVSTFQNEFSDFSERLKTDMALRDRVNVALDLEIASSGKGNLYYPSYRRVAENFVDRLEKVNDDWDLYEKMYQREDQIAKIEHGNLKERERDNIYFLSTLRDDRPATQEEIIGQLKIDAPDVMDDKNSYAEATRAAQKIIDKDPEAGSRYSTYQTGVKAARTKNALREMAKSRGQDPDTV
jgi:hypothetical protein